MTLSNDYSFRPNYDEICSEEEYWGVKLPKDLCELIIKYNGGIPDKREFKCGNQNRMITRFLCIASDDVEEDCAEYDISMTLQEIEERIVSDPDLIGYNIIPFATLFGGDLVCLDYRKSDTPTVCVWDHEQSEEWKPSTQKVANSFAEFMQMIF
jgi:hypothetical protein